MCIPDIGNCKNPEPKLARVFSEFEVGCWTIRVGLAFNRRAHGGQEEEVLTKCTEFLNEFGRSLISVEASATSATSVVKIVIRKIFNYGTKAALLRASSQLSTLKDL